MNGASSESIMSAEPQRGRFSGSKPACSGASTSSYVPDMHNVRDGVLAAEEETKILTPAERR